MCVCSFPALDTLAIMGNYTEFNRVYQLLAGSRTDFDANINVSVFETNIRIVGGLLSAHLLAHRGKGLQTNRNTCSHMLVLDKTCE